jgi:hypothetical protein
MGSHARHIEPIAPQLARDGVVHVVPEQQPIGHDVASHTQAPPLQRWPAPHTGPEPHAQLPFAHRSACVASQATQATPLVPHVAVAGVRHVLPEQQPLGHDVASHTHTPPLQRWPTAHIAPAPHAHAPALQRSARTVSHATHAPPAVPHAAVLGVLHVDPEQHPPAQSAVHSGQVPLTHAPAAHA